MEITTNILVVNDVILEEVDNLQLTVDPDNKDEMEYGVFRYIATIIYLMNLGLGSVKTTKKVVELIKNAVAVSESECLQKMIKCDSDEYDVTEFYKVDIDENKYIMFDRMMNTILQKNRLRNAFIRLVLEERNRYAQQ